MAEHLIKMPDVGEGIAEAPLSTNEERGLMPANILRSHVCLDGQGTGKASAADRMPGLCRAVHLAVRRGRVR